LGNLHRWRGFQFNGEVFMSLIWREQLSVGNDLIDEDHKYLIEIINQAEHSLLSKNQLELKQALENLFRYSKAHFQREEKIALAVGYPQAAELHVSHEALLARLDKVSQELKEDWSVPAVEHFIAFLREWLINHVIKEDMLMKPFLKVHSPKLSPR
jgi:hemerythrin